MLLFSPISAGLIAKMLPMAFVNDLDPLAWAAMFAAVLAFCSVTFLNFRDWRNDWTVDFGERLPIAFYLGIAFIIGACYSYSPDARAPRRSVEGVARFVAESNGKDGYNEYICASSCAATGAYALKLHGKAAAAIKIGSRYVFTYLEHPKGNAVVGISLRVIEVSDPESGRAVYQIDLTNHPYRVAAYLGDFALMVCSGVIGALLTRKQSRKAGGSHSDGEEQRQERASRGDGPISLALESKDTS